MTLQEICIPTKTIFLPLQDYHKMIIQDKFTRHLSKWKSTEQRCMKNMLHYKIPRFLRKNWLRPKVTKIMEVPSTPQTSKVFWSKGTCLIVGDSIISGLKENLLSKKWFNKGKIFPLKYVDRMFFYCNANIEKNDPTTWLFI